jgi:hypothetical protein
MNEAPAHTICSAGEFVKTSRPLDIYKILKKGKMLLDVPCIKMNNVWRYIAPLRIVGRITSVFSLMCIDVREYGGYREERFREQ